MPLLAIKESVDKGFFGGLFLVQGFFWVMSEDLGIFLGPEFCLHSSFTSRSTPSPPGFFLLGTYLIIGNFMLRYIPIIRYLRDT